MAQDQAQKLRALAETGRPAAKVVAVTSGKGGVGKTNLASNLAIAAAQLGQKVILLDADLGLANVDIVLDLSPKSTLNDLIAGKYNVFDILVEGPGGIRVVPGANGIARLADLDVAKRTELLEYLQLLEFEADLIFIDTSAGISGNVIQFCAAADEAVIVATPEPTAITDAYAIIKTLSRTGGDVKLKFLVNQVVNRVEALRIADRVVSVSREFIKTKVDSFGYILSDPHVPVSVRRRRPFVLEFPYAPASLCVKTLATRLCVMPRRDGGGFFAKLFGFFKRSKAS
ncbi:MAG: MinD/ParA family protein [Planctomycetota bacterium]|jgi:flagellar biosynthesis protein FlhG